MRAIVFDGSQLAVRDDVEVKDPGAGEVRVRMVASGVCHSDLSVVNGTIPFPTPLVMGHEGAGIVDEVGPAVTKVKPGDHVVLSTLGNCGACPACDSGHPTHCRDTFGGRPQPFTVGGEPTFAFANASTFSEYTVVKENQAVVIDDRVPLTSASLIGCGVITGVGAVFNRAKATHGQSAAVFGVGGIGLNVIQGLRLSDALPIIAIDTNPKKEALALEFGATHFVDASAGDAAAAIREISPGGVELSFECIGNAKVIRTAIDVLDWNGTCVILGVPGFTEEGSFNVLSLLYVDRTIMGFRYGSARPQHDFPMLADLYLAGRLKLDELVTRPYPRDGVQQALDDMHHGDVARGVLTISDP